MFREGIAGKRILGDSDGERIRALIRAHNEDRAGRACGASS
jgi:hypothetical protein